MNRFFTLGCLFAAVGVTAGAFGAHGFKGVLSTDMLAVYETAVRYQMYHSFGLIAVGVLSKLYGEEPRTVIAGWCFVGGIILFSGSLYALTLTDIRWLSAITPIGGVAFILGWAMLGLSFSQSSRKL